VVIKQVGVIPTVINAIQSYIIKHVRVNQVLVVAMTLMRKPGHKKRLSKVLRINGRKKIEIS
jgi:hypothetical protein